MAENEVKENAFGLKKKEEDEPAGDDFADIKMAKIFKTQ